MLNWDVQKTVWDYIFSKDCCKANFSEMPLIITEPYMNFATIQEGMTEMFFEEYECQSLLRTNSNYSLNSSGLNSNSLYYFSRKFVFLPLSSK